MPIPPYDHPLNLTMQTVVTVVLWTATALILAIAIRRGLRERSVFPVVVVVAVAVGSFIEPLYDIAYHLLWYVPGQWTLFTSFGLPQPVWVMPAYVVVFGAPALYLYPKFERGVSLLQIFKWAGLTAITTAVFEVIMVNVGLYGYYGPHPFRLLGYPLWISVMEAVQITGFAVLVAVLKRRARKQVTVLGLFVLYPAHFAFALLGAGFPALIAMNSTNPSTVLVWVTGTVSMAFAAVALVLVSEVLINQTDSAGTAIEGERTVANG